jgi:hypothetical protein
MERYLLLLSSELACHNVTAADCRIANRNMTIEIAVWTKKSVLSYWALINASPVDVGQQRQRTNAR